MGETLVVIDEEKTVIQGTDTVDVEAPITNLKPVTLAELPGLIQKMGKNTRQYFLCESFLICVETTPQLISRRGQSVMNEGQLEVHTLEQRMGGAYLDLASFAMTNNLELVMADTANMANKTPFNYLNSQART